MGTTARTLTARLESYGIFCHDMRENLQHTAYAHTLFTRELWRTWADRQTRKVRSENLTAMLRAIKARRVTVDELLIIQSLILRMNFDSLDGRSDLRL